MSRATVRLFDKDLQSMLTSRKVSERLNRIQKDWKDWPRMIDRISTLRANLGRQPKRS